MDHGPRRRWVQRALGRCLSTIRRFGHLPDAEFAEAVCDLPKCLRESADAIESPPPEEAVRRELPGWTGYDLWSETYDHEPDNPVVTGEEEVIWDLIGPPAGLRVLDVGCGTGRHAIALAERGAEVVGLEPSEPMLARARRKAEQGGLAIDLRAGSLDDVTSELGRFNLVLCCLVLSHVEDLAAAVAKLASCVAPGGRLIVSDFHPLHLLLGFRTGFASRGEKYFAPNFVHGVSEYFDAMVRAGLGVTRLAEPGEFDTLPGIPATLVLAGERPDA